MADRRFTMQTDARTMNAAKTTVPIIGMRDDILTQFTTVGSPPTNTTTVPNVSERRPSQGVFRRLSMSLGNSRKSSMFPLPNQPRPNTYRMEPDSEYRFRPYKLQAKILDVLADELKGKKYNPTTTNEVISDITRSVLRLVKNFPLSRYKIIVHTVLVQKFEQFVRVASRCLWNPKTDNMVSVSYEADDMVAVVTVYATYFE